MKRFRYVVTVYGIEIRLKNTEDNNFELVFSYK